MQRAMMQAKSFIVGFWRAWRRVPPTRSPEVAQFLDDLFDHFPFDVEAEEWVRDHVWIVVKDIGSVSGGGLFFPGQNRIELNTAQYEAAIHELAHAWWHVRRGVLREAFIAAVVRAASEPNARFQRIAVLARGYVYGLEEIGFPGFLHDGNDGEMFAGLASGCMADIRLLPPYLRPFFTGLFATLPASAPAPETEAPHG
jgi:hypothetical protein